MSYILNIEDIVSQRYENLHIRISSRYITVKSYYSSDINIELTIPPNTTIIEIDSKNNYMVGFNLEVVTPYINIDIVRLKYHSIFIYGKVQNIHFLNCSIESVYFHGYVYNLTLKSTLIINLICLYINRVSIRDNSDIECFRSNIINRMFTHSSKGQPIRVYCSNVNNINIGYFNKPDIITYPSDTMYINYNHVCDVKRTPNTILNYMIKRLV